MLLSIGMIVKNEEKYIRYCLTALKPILSALESELIICDTGSTDGTVDIAREFTDKVFHIEWRDDFAWARNQTIKEATGKWYLVIDADEIFEDTDDLIEFFKSGEHDFFNSASVRIDNIGASSEDFSPPRLFRMFEGICYEGKIHEKIDVQFPVKRLKSKILHYGYDYETLEQKRAKTERNLPILLEELKSTPDDARKYWHVVNEYLILGDYYEAIRQVERGIAIARPDYMYIHGLCLQHVQIFQTIHRHEDVIKAARNYFEKVTSIQQVAIEIMLIEASAFYNLKKYDEAIAAYKQAHKLYLLNKAGKLGGEVSLVLPINTSYMEDESHSIRGIFNVYATMGDFEAGWEWASSHQEILLNVKKAHMYIIYVSKAVSDKRYDDIANLYEYAVENHPTDSEDFTEVVSTIEAMVTDSEAREAVVEAVVRIADAKTPPHTDDYAMLARLRVMYKNREPELEDALKHFLYQSGTINQIYAEVIVYSIYTSSDFSGFLEKLLVTNTEELCRSLCMVDDARAILLEYIDSNLPQDASAKQQRLMGNIANYLLAVATSETPSKDEEERILQNETKIRLFEVTARLNHRHLKHMYKEEAYNETSGALSERDAFFFYAGTAYEKMDAGDISGFVKNMRHVVKISEQVRDVAKLILKKLAEEHSPPEPESMESLQTQLKDEIANLKDIIYASIKAQDRERASMLINNYEAINPKDPDIPTIKKMIENWIKEGK